MSAQFDPNDTKLSSFDLLKRSLSYFIPYKWSIILAFFAMIVTGLCGAGAAWLVKPALDDIFINKKEEALVLIPILFLLITIGKAGGKVLQNYLMQHAGLKVLETLREELFNKIISLPLRFFEQNPVGLLMSRVLNDVGAVRGSLPAIIEMGRASVTILALLCVAFYQNPQLAFWALIVLPLAFYPFIYFGRRLRKLGRKSQTQSAQISTTLQEILSGVRVVKAFCTEKNETARFDAHNRALLRNSLKQSISGEFSSAIMEIIGAIGIALVIWFGGMHVIRGQSDPGAFFSFVTAMIMLYEPVKKITSSNNAIQRALAGAEWVFGMLDSTAIVEEKSGTKLVQTPFHGMSFNNVSFCYNEGENVLQNVSFEIKAGERIAIVGPSGAGKTTFVNLIPRFYDPQEGVITLNGLSLAEYELGSLRQNVAVVSQDNFLFNTSVLDNIIYGQTNVSEADVIASAKAAYAHDFITTMPAGYDTVVGERGVTLSGGQKQRVTIARALVKNAPLLILDEATSALDSEAERIVQLALDNLMQGRTSVVIAHRLSTIISADKIIVMDKGKIVAQGSHDELLGTSPLYTKLYTMQYQIEQCAVLGQEEIVAQEGMK